MITSYSKEDSFVFLGKSYENLNQFRNQLTIVNGDPAPFFSVVRDLHDNLYLVRFQLYPCFDSSDWMYENRYYRYIFYCENSEDLEKKLDYLKNKPDLGTCAQDDPKLIPNIFYGEDTLYFEIADTK